MVLGHMLFVTDSANHCIRMLTPAGHVVTVVGFAGASGFQVRLRLGRVEMRPDLIMARTARMDNVMRRD